MTSPVTARLKLDAKRRPTLPSAVLDAAGVGAGQDLIARVEGPGHIVLESPAVVLARLQAVVATSHPSADEVDLVRELLDGRAADAAAELDREAERDAAWQRGPSAASDDRP